jgi:hypothetical protein
MESGEDRKQSPVLAKGYRLRAKGLFSKIFVHAALPHPSGLARTNNELIQY